MKSDKERQPRKSEVDMDSMQKHHYAVLHAAHLKGMTEAQAMNLLQDFGIISDLCVWIADIPKEDAIRAEEFILKHEATE